MDMDVVSVIRSAPAFVVVLAVGTFLAMAAVAVVAGVAAARTAAAVAATPVLPIAGAPDGPCAVEGRATAVPGLPLLAPLTRRRCCWYRARVEKFVPRTPNRSATWSVVREVTSDVPFLVRDGGELCAVHPAGAEVTPTLRSVWYGPGPVPDERDPPSFPPGAAGFLKVATGGTPGRRYRYTEDWIAEGDPVYVLAEMETAAPRPSPSQRSRRRPADADDETGDPVVDEGAEVDADQAALDAMHAAVSATTPRALRRHRHSGGRFVIAAGASGAEHRRLSALGAKAAVLVALVPLAAAVGLAWLRWGS
ncbi:MAG: E3 ubiquitin ligase family protein [Thermoanaerobaculales bacterium]|jgi:hypothetical protein|nr:E3 ubiquitin ligase family protein [Thermoanaerobaculales bacterium]